MSLAIKYGLFSLSLAICILFCFGLYFYSGSKVVYILFSFVYFALLITSLYKTPTYGYIFIGIFFFLGIWLKATAHIIFDYDYIEPVGRFFSSKSSMDDVFIVSMVGAIAVLLSRILFFFLEYKKRNNYIKIVNQNTAKLTIYHFYKKYQTIILLFIIIVVFMTSYLNLRLNIQVIGLVPTTILMWPLNALWYYMLSIGFILIYSYLFLLEIFIEKKIKLLSVFIFLFIALLCSIGILSRGTFVFFFLGLFMFIIFNYRIINLKLLDMVAIIISSLCCYGILFYLVSELRDLFYHRGIFDILQASYFPSLEKTYQYYNIFTTLIVDRWIGLESIMSAVSYPFKSFDVFYGMLINDPNIITHLNISDSHYMYADNTKYRFGSASSSMAFFFFSGSYFVLFLGLCIFVLIMLNIEKIIFYMLNSVLYSAIIGVSLASATSSFGGDILLYCKFLCFLFILTASIKAIEYLCEDTVNDID